MDVPAWLVDIGTRRVAYAGEAQVMRTTSMIVGSARTSPFHERTAMPDPTISEVLKIAIETAKGAVKRPNDATAAVIITALTSIDGFINARVSVIRRRALQDVEEVIVDELNENRIRRRVQSFEFPPNDLKTLAEFKRAQDHDLDISVFFQVFGDTPRRVVKLDVKSPTSQVETTPQSSGPE